jgi:SAM-dependent methyltransferase
MQSEAEARARASGGHSEDAVYELVASEIRDSTRQPGTLVDVGCGGGALASRCRGLFTRYIGCDLVKYDGFPAEHWASFRQADLNRSPYPLEDASADVAVAVETIEHLENPRALMRELTRIVRPGGLVIVTTPNQLSFLSKLTLVVKNEFNAFQESAGLYPAHITALVESDLDRIARECGLKEIRLRYTDRGRIPGTALSWPRGLGFKGRTFSDNVLLRGVR